LAKNWLNFRQEWVKLWPRLGETLAEIGLNFGQEWVKRLAKNKFNFG